MYKYIGITIGPIVDTLCEATKPVALWFASSLFSDFTRRLCKKINDEYREKVHFISPYFDENMDLSDGVGKFHDRIILKMDSFDDKIGFDKLISCVKEETYTYFPKEKSSVALSEKENKSEEEKAYLCDYLQVHYIILEGKQVENKNPILELSPYLDALELMRSFPDNQSASPIRRVFRAVNIGEENANIRRSKLFKDVVEERNQFYIDINDKKIRKIEDIAKGKLDYVKEYKKKKYFAVVSADGDNMSTFLKELKDDKEVIAFSEACLNYATKAAELIGKFGGMTIYAGGDDLLFLSPLEGIFEYDEKDEKEDKKVVRESGNILILCHKLNELFQNSIESALEKKYKEEKDKWDVVKEKIPTVSFGIAVHYYKYPLYEAFENSRNLLSFVKNNTKKNASAMSIEKHSGQFIGALIPHQDIDIVKTLSGIKINNNEKLETDSDPEIIKSVIYTLEKMKNLMKGLDEHNYNYRKEIYVRVWKNIFDNPTQTDDFYTDLGGLYYDTFSGFSGNQNAIRALQKNKYRGVDLIEDSIQTFIILLRMKKFFYERG